ncbi:ArgS-related anticodon-binding protein NrtL [Streptomyces sp. H27-C3]|uniref:ArgS-related anticodon-binding protein NrtL n=1 Tax=Streptomyces sp. H27-C3 TaxID=3046305 RepID=UPI0024B99353|nr:DALR anticodon-binding domain-containing protein [Streptomyces sp. H27-C3]MDJ0462247.1 DALR anticodon-binding domain-containing protein [Streptomyces sp. H27-C3]
MTPADLSRTVVRAVRRAVAEGVLRAPVPERAVVERPRPGGRGDYATNVALKLAGPAGMPAREVAEILRSMLDADAAIAGVEITGPGFLNFTLAPDPYDTLVRTVLQEGSTYGHGAVLAGQTVRVGPGPRADAVARLLLAQDATVLRTDEDGSADGPTEGTAVLVARLGHDAAVWSLLLPTAAATDDDLLAQRESNSLFRVRYAHARTRALTRNAADLGFRAAYEEAVDAPGLLGALADHPAVLEAAARRREPERLARHLDTVADRFFRFHDACPVLPVGDEKPSVAHRSRLALAEATGAVLAGGLSLLGISAPEHL